MKQDLGLFNLHTLGTSLFLFCLTSLPYAKAADKQAPAGEAEEMNVDSIKKRYWARGDESELGVVQNRLFSKEKKFQFSAFAGSLISDPFLTVNNVGGAFGYHFDETYSIHIVGWKHFVRDSDALETLKNERNATTNTNEPNYYFGIEPNFSFLYGKLSLLGKRIIHYDMHLSAGVGMTDTETGNYITPSAGIGQRFYLAKSTSLKIDYRMTYYREDIVEKQIVTKLGNRVGSRNNWTSVITVGVDFLFGGPGGPKK